MRSTTTVHRGRFRRVLALSAAFATLVVCGPVQPATAQDEEGTAPDSGRTVQPPPLPDDVGVPSGKLSQNGGFTRQRACLAASEDGSRIRRQPWSQRVLGFGRAHDQGLTGAGQTVAVIDTGVNRHPRLRGRLVEGGSTINTGALRDCDGHGTVVAGIIAAGHSDETGFVGVAPESTILSIRQSSDIYKNEDSGKKVGNTKTMAQAVASAVAQGADVINISQASCQSIARALAPNEPNQQLQKAVKQAYEQNVVVVAAAGNAGGECEKNEPGDPGTAVLPAWFDEYVLTVASVNRQGAPSEFTIPGPWVDVAAPGEDLISLDPGTNGSGLVNRVAHGSNSRPEPLQGTSFAAPYVSGLAALIKERYPELSAAQVMRRITETAQHHGGTNGSNDIIGYGMVNPMAAINDVIPAEHDASAAPVEPRRLEAHVFPQRNWAAIAVAMGGTIGGLATVLFTAFLLNAVRRVRARRRNESPVEPETS
ncbi:membrane-anchored mycosin MYCP [Actinopolyspora xinjiangensis]|uniref:Membrane-anchored mycosin MYCP n=1 Tax=Actinopolyspora xinjiangensis TaxID=405564 RepID=A0A1H0Q3G2_9ACTN|nr:type VII secretion-associated serine protease mycosin [Actinopolyspora xinjiangensis]SDP11957.1 membrane-anchored mycosin MYCP [Actinopolyspora xinjiangensis]